MSDRLVSICIPTYKKPLYVARCLTSILAQNYKNIEVIVSDDSPDETIKEVVTRFSGLNIGFVQNKPALKSPRNWNAALDKATGEFLLLLHQDDWLSSPESISRFVEAFTDSNVDFAFCKNIGQDEKGKEVVFQNKSALPDFSIFPEQLIIRSVIGPPSNVMLRKRVATRYDENLIWLVDVDYYIRILKDGYKYRYLPEQLVTIGLHADQTTEYVRANAPIILEENFYVLNKLGASPLKNVFLFDYFWRLIRNFGEPSTDNISVTDPTVAAVIKQIKRAQKGYSKLLLQNGFFSKGAMFATYLKWRYLSGN